MHLFKIRKCHWFRAQAHTNSLFDFFMSYICYFDSPSRSSFWNKWQTRNQTLLLYEAGKQYGTTWCHLLVQFLSRNPPYIFLATFPLHIMSLCRNLGWCLYIMDDVSQPWDSALAYCSDCIPGSCQVGILEVQKCGWMKVSAVCQIFLLHAVSVILALVKVNIFLWKWLMHLCGES